NGLYSVALDNLDNVSYTRRALAPVAGSEGQVWSLSTVNNQVLMGHHEGAFLVENNRANLLDNSTGFWTFLPASNVLPSSLMVAGNYLGLRFYDFANGRFQKAGMQAQFESARFVVAENDHVFWVAHPYKGLFRVQLNAGNTVSITLYDRNKGLCSVNNNYVFRVKNRIVAATEKGIYEYNSLKDVFEVSTLFKDVSIGSSIRYLKEDQSGNIWFVHQKGLGVVDFSETRPRLIYFPELNNKLVNGFENIYPLNEHNIFIGSEKGFYHVDFENYKRNTHALQTQLRIARAIGKKDTLLFGGYGTPLKTEVSYKANSLHFEYSAILYGQQPNIEYSYCLKGFDHNWSAWAGKTEKDYTNLPAGDYIFQVKARTNLGNESAVYSYAFTILPPWYQTPLAYFVYALAFLLLIFYLHRQQKKKFLKQQQKFEEQQRQLQYLHQLELEKNEKEIVKLRNEKLEAELAHKNTELASSAMHLVQKGELLSKIKDELVKLNKDSHEQQSPNEVKKIIKILGTEEKMDEDWEQFAQHFDKVHSDFLLNLKKKFPNLTPNESKLCAYLRMNLSTKEIAQLMNISVRGVEISRYRLRKKLELPTAVNLFDFLIKIDDSNT
ncbi:MAG TPA: triple tyrosine motif-containing protein, partial [Flavisolibacter sp.]|nr:triple tyrosine motif-containing protein [Flavisolibacter sp.]